MTHDREAAAAADIAGRAADLLLTLRLTLGRAGISSDELGAQGDRQSNELIIEALTAAFPEDPILSEESADDRARLHSSRVWIVDPLDGTREFREGRDDWAVHVALVVEGRPVAAAVALPAQGLVLSSAPPEPLPAPTGSRPRMVVSRTRPPQIAEALAAALGAEMVPMGSAGAKAMAVVRGEADLYVHSGGQYEWDSAAPVGVAAAAGCHTSRLDGSPLRYNQPETWLPDQLICRPELAAGALAALASRAAPGVITR